MPSIFHHHDPVSISLGQALVVSANLFYLKFLHAIAYLCSCQNSTSYIKRSITNTEIRILDIFFAVVPETFYRTRHEMLQSQIARLLEAGAVVVEVGNGGERISGSTQHGSSENHSPLMHVSSSISPAVRMSRNISQPVVTCVEVCSSGSGSGSENGNGCVAGGASESVYSVTGTRGSLERNLSESSDGIQPMVSAAQFAKTTPNLSNVSGQPGGPCVFDSQVNKAPTRMERLHVSRSMESYPGRYPVSDHLDYSSLATPVSQMRGRGTTSVRPFSEV